MKNSASFPQATPPMLTNTAQPRRRSYQYLQAHPTMENYPQQEDEWVRRELFLEQQTPQWEVFSLKRLEAPSQPMNWTKSFCSCSFRNPEGEGGSKHFTPSGPNVSSYSLIYHPSKDQISVFGFFPGGIKTPSQKHHL